MIYVLRGYVDGMPSTESHSCLDIMLRRILVSLQRTRKITGISVGNNSTHRYLCMKLDLGFGNLSLSGHSLEK